MKNAKLCVVTAPYWHYTLEYAMNSIASSGFSSLELWAASPHYCYADYTQEERQARRREILAMMERYGLDMPVFYPEQMNKYPLNIASAEEEIRQFSLERVLEYVDDAALFGAESMLLGTGWQHLDAPSPENRERAVSAIRTVSCRAEERGITLLLEPAAPVLGSFVWDLDSLVRMLHDVGCANVKACLNLALILERGESAADWYSALNGRVGHVHFAGQGGRDPGSGSGVSGALRALDALGYTGHLSLNITFRDCCLTPDREVFRSGRWLSRQGFLQLPRPVSQEQCSKELSAGDFRRTL